MTKQQLDKIYIKEKNIDLLSMKELLEELKEQNLLLTKLRRLAYLGEEYVKKLNNVRINKEELNNE